MPQTKTPDSKFNLAPNRERRVASQVPNSPVADDSDPTREIRRVIDELQETGQSTRERLRIVEHERDTLAAQVVATGKQLLELKSHEQQFKQQLADAAALQREQIGRAHV